MKKIRNKIFSISNTNNKRSNMAKIIIVGWFLPLVLLTGAILLILSGSMNRSARNTVKTSAQKAVEILGMRLNDCELASKNASYLPVIQNSYRTFLSDGDKKDLNESVTTFLKQQYRYHTNLKDAVLVFTAFPEELYYTYNNSKGGTYKDIQTFSQNTLSSILAESEALDTDTRLYGDNGRIYMIRNLMDSKFHPYAMLILELDRASLTESLQSVWGYADGALYLQDEVLLAGGEGITEAVASGAIDFDTEGKNRTAYTTYGGHSYVTGCLNQYGEIHAVVELDDGIIYAERKTYLFFVLILLIMLVPLLVIMRQYEQIYREELSLRDARIRALQSQINPHFLNNTLEIINWEARLAENYKISGMIEALSTMLSATMNRKSEAVHTLREEMSYVDAYLYIIERRFGEQLRVIKEIDESLMEQTVPRLIIQPIVENAVDHGKDASRQNTVVIRISRDEDYMLIEIENSGSLTEEEKSHIQDILYGSDDSGLRHTSVGIRNVNSRLKLIYGEECGLTIDNRKRDDSVCTVSTIKITISDKKNQR
ncbi:MAG: histidine kinase [Lachnospiraceae bacterium]|nr:histidine kinase [Lachnospiraceae bacterium]